jgi:hypothetical protein
MVNTFRLSKKPNNLQLRCRHNLKLENKLLKKRLPCTRLNLQLPQHRNLPSQIQQMMDMKKLLKKLKLVWLNFNKE